MNLKKSSRASVFSLLLILNMIFFSFYGNHIAIFLGSDSLLFLIVTQLLVYGIPMFLYFEYYKENPKYVFKFKKLSLINIFLIIGISIFIQPFLMLISALSSAVFGTSTSDFIKSFEDFPVYYTILSTSLLPALTEELSFRGIVFSSLKGKSIFKACLFTGLLFGMAHLNGEQFFYATVMGAIFSYFVYRTGSIFSSILSHFTINFSQTALTLYYLKAGVYDSIETTNISFLETIASALLLTLYMAFPLLILWLFFEFHNRKKATNGVIIETEEATDYENDGNDRLLSIPFFIIVAIFVVYILFN